MFQDEKTRARTNFSSWPLATRMVFAFLTLFFFSKETERRAFDEIVRDLRRAYLTFHLIGDDGKEAMKMISLSGIEISVASVPYSGSMDDMAAMLSMSSPWEGERLDFLE